MNKTALLTMSLILLLLPFLPVQGDTALATPSEPSVLGNGISGGRDNSGNYFMESDHLLVKFDGNNPHVSFFMKTNDTPTATFYKIMYASLNETDANGNVVNFYRLEQASWEASDVLQYTENNVSVIYVNFTTTLSIRSGYGVFTNVPMTIETFMYESTRTILVGNETVTIPAGAFKYSILLGAWPFASENNTLSLGINLISNMDAAFHRNNQTGDLNATTTDGIRFSMTNPDVAVLDGVETTINSSLVKYGGMTFITYDFPYYQQDLYYDPVVNLQQSSTTDDGGTDDGGTDTPDTPSNPHTPSDLELESATIKVLFEGTTPHVKFFIKDSETNITTYYKLVFASLNESTPSGSLVKFQRLETAIWTASGVTQTTINGVTVLQISFNTNMRVITVGGSTTDVPITIHASLYLGNTTITYANTTLTIPSGSFKYTVEIGAWPFASQENTLTLAVMILSNVRTHLKYNAGDHGLVGETDDGVIMKMDNPEIAVVDGVPTEIAMNMATHAARTYITYTFPYFNESLVYDPVITLSTSTSGETTSTDNGFNLLGWSNTTLFLTGISALLIALPVIRKRSKA